MSIRVGPVIEKTYENASRRSALRQGRREGQATGWRRAKCLGRRHLAASREILPDACFAAVAPIEVDLKLAIPDFIDT
jgi:hypothetical protein